MSSRPQFSPFPVIVDGDMSGDIVSVPTIAQKLSMLSYDISWTGTAPIGEMSVEVSNSYSQNADGTVKNAGNWTTLTLSAPTPVTGSPGNGFIDINLTSAYAIRLRYTRTSGTGVMNAVLNAKVA